MYMLEFIADAIATQNDNSEKLICGKNDYYELVELRGLSSRKQEDLAQYISEYDSKIFAVVKSIIIYYDYEISKLVFEVTSEKDDPDTVAAIKEYIDAQISDGWGEGGYYLFNFMTEKIIRCYSKECLFVSPELHIKLVDDSFNYKKKYLLRG